MKIVFFTEMNFRGKISRNHPNMRTEFAWMCTLDAVHYNYMDIPEDQYDLGIVIIPKNPSNHFNIDRIKQSCLKVAVMQEGPNWYWQDYELPQQIEYYNTLLSSDILYVHNKSDLKYFKGLTSHPDIRVMPSLMIEDSIPLNILGGPKSGTIIGGNMTSWYGGFDSMIIAQEFDQPIYAPSMGRKNPREHELDINHLPYMEWSSWIQQLNNFKYAIHLMRTHAAGTFALNCAFLGIPCIGYEGLDTQMICHPKTTVKLGDLNTAKKIAKRLRDDEEFYIHCSKLTQEKYQENFHENIFNTTFKKQFKIS